MTYIKTLRADGTSPHQSRPWPLPVQNPDGTWMPGEWIVSTQASARTTPLTPADADACVPAVYGCRVEQLPEWIRSRRSESGSRTGPVVEVAPSGA